MVVINRFLLLSMVLLSWSVPILSVSEVNLVSTLPIVIQEGEQVCSYFVARIPYRHIGMYPRFHLGRGGARNKTGH